jgi:glycosyltransferase involved in cell wall biosynthesis
MPPFGEDVGRIWLGLDDLPMQRARIGCPRPDLAELTSHPYAPIAGFEAWLDLSVLPPGRREVALRLVAEDHDAGRTAEKHLPLTVRPRPAPSIADPVRRPPPRTSASDPLRLTAVAHNLQMGGAQTFMRNLLLELEALGVASRVVAMGPGPHGRDLEDAGIPVVMTPPCPVDNPSRYERWLEEARDMADLADTDVLLANTLMAFPLADLATRDGIPVLWSVHEGMGMRAFWKDGYPVIRLSEPVRELAEAAFRHASIVVPAPSALELYSRELGERAPRVIPVGLDHHLIGEARDSLSRTSARAELGLPDSGTVALALGSFEPRKGQGLLVNAFARLAERHPGAVLVLVGALPGQVYSDAVEEVVERIGLGLRVRIEPLTPDPYKWLAAADLLVSASDTEIVPFSVLEAMAFGLPVAVTDVGSVGAVVEEGRSGFLCEAGDQAQLTRMLDRALSLSAEERVLMGKAGAEMAAREHRQDETARAYRDALLATARGTDDTSNGR